MEVIPPSNLQNPQTPITQPSADTQPDEEKKESIFDFIKSSIFELFLVLLFSIIILTTFNYFNLIPLSSIFPALSFLPQQQTLNNYQSSTSSQDDITFFNNGIMNLSACTPPHDNNIILNSIVTCKNPTKVLNSGQKPIYTRIVNSDFTSDSQIQINFALKVIQGKDYKPSGLMLGGGPEENRMYISYDNNSNSWGVQFLTGKDITPFESLYTTPSSSVQRTYFSVIISKDGKQIVLLLPNGIIQTYNLKGSLYSKDGTIPSTAVVYPNSEVDIYSLNYYTPQSQ